MTGSTLSAVLQNSSFHLVVEALLLCLAAWFYIQKKKSARRNRLPKFSKEVEEELIAAWEAEPLVPDTPPDHIALNTTVHQGKMTKFVITEDGRQCLHLSSTNFLGFIGDERIEGVARQTIFKYGVGSCGPRGFYGTVDVHLELEKELAAFMQCEEAALYSYGFATVASAIPAYAKKGDIVYVDKGSNFAVQKGMQACRATIVWFEHNDMEDLERKLEEQAAKDKKDPRKANTIRRFIVVEGLYANDGSICPLPKIIEYKWKYKTRVFLDESYSFGVLGKTGRGVTEYYGLDPIQLDLIMASLENSFASIGGFCCGRSYVVGHQRLSGLGYCFSASLPPLLATAANEALHIIQEQPERLARVQRHAKELHDRLTKAFEGTRWSLHGEAISPLKYIQWDGESTEASKKLDRLVEKALADGVVIRRALYLMEQELFKPPPSIRVTTQSEFTAEEHQKAIEVIAEAARQINEEGNEVEIGSGDHEE